MILRSYMDVMHDEITIYNFNSLNSEFAKAHLDHVGLVPHAADLGHIPHLLLHQGRLKRHKHEQCENTVVPVLVQTPQPHAEHLMGVTN